MQQIPTIYKSAKSPVFSFEFFPPKTDEGQENLYSTIEKLSVLNPGFVSITYGAGGSTREKTFEIAASICKKYPYPAMAHFTCVGGDSQAIDQMLSQLQGLGVSNIMALRGDPPVGSTAFSPVPGGFSYASELIKFIKQKYPAFSIGGGCYPEKHPESRSMESEIQFTKVKADAGADFLVSQLFFENRVYCSFVEKLAGIGIPIIPGIMPITEFKQIDRFRKMAGCSIPESLVENLARYEKSPEDFQKISLDYTYQQCLDLISYGVKGIHFYTLNQSNASYTLVKRLLAVK